MKKSSFQGRQGDVNPKRLEPRSSRLGLGARSPGIAGRLVALAAALPWLAACSSDARTDDGVGQIVLEAWGEEYIEEGIGAAEFADGWSVTFDKFLVVLGGFKVADSAKGPGAAAPGPWLLDLVSKGPHRIATLEGVRAGSHDQVGYSLLPATAGVEVVGTVASADRALMVDSQLSVHVSGQAVKAEQAKAFSWSFSEHVDYSRCVDVSGVAERDGLVVPKGGSLRVELTIHGDHFFYDDLASEAAELRFAPLFAADADGDDMVTLAELAAVALVDVSDGPYGTGALSNVNDLRAYVTALVRSLGHYNGEGHCHAE